MASKIAPAARFLRILSSDAKAATPNASKASKAKQAGKSDGKESKKEQRERFNDLLDSCLNAPSPVRALKEKDRRPETGEGT
ncbi:hypothetical protein R1flu_009717 [Riccia fluitans]|uniref:Uncharacterized protein n=1 Tax=Riccia fluitans TaxID=41844 RepID=A0ABD1Z341_9MARC